MQVDLDGDGAQIAALPRFQQAVVQGRRLRQFAMGLGALAAIGLVLAFFVGLFAPQSLWPALLVNQSAGLLVLVAGLVGNAVARTGDESGIVGAGGCG